MKKGLAKYYLSKVNPIWTLVMLSGLNLLVMHYYILCIDIQDFTDPKTSSITTIFDNIFGISIDICFLVFFFSILTWWKTKTVLLLTFITTCLWSFINVFYARFFHHYISLSAIGQGNIIMDDLIIKCIVSNFKWTDLYYMFVCIIFWYNWSNNKYESRSVVLISKTYLTSFILLLISLSVHAAYCIYYENLRNTSCYLNRLYNCHIANNRTIYLPNLSNFERGCIRNLYSEAFLALKGNIYLNENQRIIINNVLKESICSTTNTNIDKSDNNIIFILVESYMSFTSDMAIDGKEITPFLNSLKRDSTVYFNGKMHENVTNGESFDGQFIYMTGLLPLHSILTVSKARHIPHPALPKLLHKKSRMIIPTPVSIWNQDDMCHQYGFDSLTSSDDFTKGEHNSFLTDEQVFYLAEKMDDTSIQPFFSVILTISMHQPYNEQIDSSFIIKSPVISDELACYLNACHYTDHQIEKYIAHLKQKGIYDNSLIVIAADHPVHTTDFGGRSKAIPLYIVNIPSSIKKIMWKGECNQIDVFTTILDLLNVKSGKYGLGCSLLSPNYSNKISNQKWEVSEWIIRGNYFQEN